MINKFFKSLLIFFIILGISFSNIPFYALTGLIDSYEKTSNIVDKMWLVEQDHGSDVVDKFESIRNVAEKIKIYNAMAAVANDAASESHTGTTGSTNAASFSWTHTPVGTPRGVLVFVTTISATKKVTGVTYGGVAMTEITGGAAVDTATEPGRIDTFFLGASVPTGAQTIVVNRTNDATIMYAAAATQTAGANTEVYLPGIVLLQNNGTFAIQSVTDGSTGVNSVRYAAGYSGGASVLPAGSGSTVLNSIDFGAYTQTFARETTAGQGARNVGFNYTTSDDRAAVHLAIRENTPPTITVTQPDGTGDTVTAGDLYNITYDLADTDNVVAAAMYYDADAVGLNGTAITGACATAAEGTGATCSWDTTGMTPGTYYVYGITNDGVNPQVSDYSPGIITINAPAANLTISASTGAKVASLNSGDTSKFVHNTSCTTDGTCAAFKLAASGGAVSVTQIKVTEFGTVDAFNNLSNPTLIYDTDANYSNGTAGTFGSAANFASDQTVTFTNAGLSISSGNTYYFYMRFDLANGSNYPAGGNGIDFKINASSDVVSDGTESGTATLVSASSACSVTSETCVKPQITSYTNSTESGLNYAGSCTGCGARIGPYSTTQHQTVVISGYGFGADPGSGSRDTATNKVEVVGASTLTMGDDGSASTNVSAWSNTSITIKTNSELTGNADTDWGTNFGGAAALKVTAGGQAVPTNLNFYVFPQITSLSTNTGVANGVREYSGSDNHGVVTLNGTRFGSAQGTGYVRLLGCDSSTCSSPSGSVAIDSWSNTAIAARVPTVIADNAYTGAVDMQQGTGGNSKTGSFSTLRVLPRIVSTAPVDAKGGQSQAITVTGNHFCQDSSCADYATDSDDATFNSVSAKSSYTAVSDTSISLSVPATASDGNLIVKSDSANGGTVYDSNGYSYNVKFGPSTPTGSSGGGSNNPALSGSAFSDGTDGDTHQKTQWQVAHNADGDWATPEWIRTSGSAETGTTANTTNGTFQNSDAGQTELDCGTTYKGRVRYMDNSNGGADAYSWEWSAWSSNYTFSSGACNASPSISISQPPAGNVNVNQGDSYNITYTLSDTDDIVTANFYYDTNATGTDGTAITGCQNQAEGTNATCAWNTTGYPLGAYYVYGTTTDGVNPGQNAYSAGTITIQAPPQVTASSTGTQSVNLNSGATGQYIGAAFTFQQTSGTADTITALTISEIGSANANTNLSTNAGIRYETGVASCTYDGTETLISGTFNTSDEMVLSSISIPVTVGANYTCVYAVFDVGQNASGGQTIDMEIASSTAFTLQNATTKAGTYPVQLTGTTTIRPQITSYTNSTESGLNYAGSCTGCGARIGPYSTTQHQTVVISGYGFGADPGSGSRDTATNKVEVVGASTLTMGDDGSASTNVSAWSNTSITIKTNSELTGNADTDWGTNFGGAAALKVTAGGQAVPTNLNFYVFPQITSLSTNTGVANGAREYSGSDNHGVVTLNGTRFGSAQGSGYVRLLGCDSSTCSSPSGSVAIDSWGNTAIAARVPTVIADNAYTGAVDMQQGTGGNSKTGSFSTLRVLPRIISFSPGSAPIGDQVIIIGNHLCQAGAASCPTAGSRSTASDKVVFFNSVQTPDGDVTAWGNGDSSTSGITVNVPTSATTGNVVVTSDSRASNSASFTVTAITATAPGNLKQARDSGFTNLIAEEGVATSSTVYFSATSTASSGGGTMYLQVEMRPTGNAFAADATLCSNNPYCFEGSGVSYPTAGASVTATTSTTTADATYHWRARARYNKSSTDYLSSWTVYGLNTDPDGIDLEVDTVAPPISGINSTPSTNGATITWNTTGDLSTSQVEYSTSSDMTPSTLTALADTPPETNGVTAHSVTLSNLNCGITYYFKVKSKDSGNLESTSSTQNFPTGTCPTKPGKTAVFMIIGKTTAVTNAASLTQTFSVPIPENATGTKSAFVEITGLYSVSSGSSVTVQVDSQTARQYTLPSSSGNPAHFKVIYPVDPVSPNHTLYVTVPSGMTVDIASAKITATYEYTP